MRSNKKYCILSFVVLICAIVGAEVFARYHLGLGTPPLTIKHSKIEYMFKPNQDVYRFGNRFFTNQYGMRTPPFPQKKQDQNEFRIMVFGDSVINGGNLTDHNELATTLLAEQLSQKISNQVIVGNISAGSWGPGNWLAYAQEYNLFDADMVVLVISSHDYRDNPTFKTLNENTHPTRKPLSAVIEGITRYLPRYLTKQDVKSKKLTKADSKAVKQGLSDLKRFLELAKKNSTKVLVFQHWTKPEIESGVARPGNQRIKELCDQIGITSPISLEPFFRQSIEKDVIPFWDDIHPNLIGHQLIAEAIMQNIPVRLAGKNLQR